MIFLFPNSLCFLNRSSLPPLSPLCSLRDGVDRSTRRGGSPGRNHARDVHILSCGFLLVFSAFGAAQNLQSIVNTTDNLGTISFGILYVSFTFFSSVASLVVRGIGAKNAIILGTTGYWLFIAANLKPTWYTMVPASLYLGHNGEKHDTRYYGQGQLSSVVVTHRPIVGSPPKNEGIK